MGFSDLPGHAQATGLLRRSLDAGRLAHGLLFEGDDLGVLENLARTLAKALNCNGAATGLYRGADGPDSCDLCDSCRRIDQDQHTDVQWVRPESKSRIITIGQMREAMKAIYLKPSEGRTKCSIIVAAERMNPQAANAFLKTLEEPPNESIIMLLSPQPERLLDTIRSRCLRIRLAGEGMPPLEAEDEIWLRTFVETAAQEKGGLLGRYRLLGSLLERLGKIRSATEKRLEAASPIEKYPDADPATRERWEDELQAAIEAEYRRLRSQVLVHLEWWLRDLWLLCQGDGTLGLRFGQWQELTAKVARQVQAQDAGDNLTIIERLSRQLSSNVQEALAIEVAFLQLRL